MAFNKYSEAAMSQTIVIVRGFEGEPRRLVVLDANSTRALVANPEIMDKITSGESHPVALMRSDVFRFDAAVFERLLSQWMIDGKTEPSLWRELEAWSAA
jgi:hypothetical protein